MNITRNLIIVGDSAFAEVAYEYFTHDSPYRVVAFAVEREFLTKTRLFGVAASTTGPTGGPASGPMTAAISSP